MWTDKKNRIIVNIIWTYLALIGMVYYLKIGIENRNYSNNIIYGFVAVLLFGVIEKLYAYITKKDLIYASFASGIIAIILVVGAQIEYLESVVWSLGTLVKMGLLTFFLLPFLSYIFIWYRRQDFYNVSLKRNWTRYRIYFWIWGLWFLAFLALYPGIYDYDSINQTLDFLVINKISAHHPVIHSFLLSYFMKFGKVISGSYQLGVGIYSILQMSVLAYAAEECVWFVYRKNKIGLFKLTLFFYILFPLHYVMAVWATKDVFFTAFFVLLSLEIVKFLENKEEYWQKKYNIVKYIVLVVLMCMFRNNGVYAIALVIPIFFICLRKSAVKICLYTILAIGIYYSYQNVLLPALDVSPGNMREMFSIPCQQLAKVYVERPDVFSDEEKDLLFSLIPEKNLQDYSYRPMIADVTKNYFNSDYFTDNPKAYLDLYVKIGMRSPRKYIEAFLANSLGFWYPNKSYPDDRMFHPYTEFEMADPSIWKGDYIYIERSSKFPAFEKILKKMILDTGWTKLPLISNLFVPGTYFILMCLGGMCFVYNRQWEKIVILSFWMGFWFTLLISPVALVRYAYPVIFCLPIGEYLIIDNRNGNLEKVEGDTKWRK